MPEYLAPGVYVEEVSFRSKSIEGVSTTTSGLIGPAAFGPTDLELEIITGERDAANDCAQEAFIRAYRALHQYDPTLPLGPWLFRIATNASLNYVQRWHAHESPVEELPESPEEPEEGPEATAVRREELEEVVAAMAELPPAYRAALTLRHMQQLSYQEVADALGIPLGTVKTHLHRARAALRTRLVPRTKGRS